MNNWGIIDENKKYPLMLVWIKGWYNSPFLDTRDSW